MREALRTIWNAICEAFAAVGEALASIERDDRERPDLCCTECDWIGPASECFGTVFCDCPHCLAPVLSADGKKWATHE